MKKYVVALDVGGTKVEGVLFDSDFKIVKKKRVYFKKKSKETASKVELPKKEVLEIFDNLIIELKKNFNIEGIGVSIPDVITEDGSFAGTSKISSLSNFSLRNYLEEKFNCKVVVKNDADAFAFGEQQLGAGKGFSNVVGVIYGTGIGAGIVLNGKIYSGRNGSAGEFGHNVVNPTGPVARNNFKGTVEAYAAGPNLVKNYLSAGGRIEDPNPKKIFESEEEIAKEVINDSLNYFAIGLASIMNILNPGVIVLGGGLSNLTVYKELNKLTKKYTVDGIRDRVNIVKNKLGDSAGVYGVASLVFR